MTLAGEPAEDRLGGRERLRSAGGHAELDQRDEPPVSTAPFLVRMPAEAAVRLLAAQEAADNRPSEELVVVERNAFAEHVAARQIPNGGLARAE